MTSDVIVVTLCQETVPPEVFKGAHCQLPEEHSGEHVATLANKYGSIEFHWDRPVTLYELHS